MTFNRPGAQRESVIFPFNFSRNVQPKASSKLYQLNSFEVRVSSRFREKAKGKSSTLSVDTAGRWPVKINKLDCELLVTVNRLPVETIWKTTTIALNHQKVRQYVQQLQLSWFIIVVEEGSTKVNCDYTVTWVFHVGNNWCKN